jgi:DNA-binding CsgD family transcriptional regulator
VKGIAAEAAIANLSVSGLPALELFLRLGERLRRVVPYDAGCWKPTDPETLLFTGFAIEDSEPRRLASVRWRFVENELLEPDFAKFRDLARRPRPVTTLHEETHGEPERSARYRKIHRELGFGAELRAVFRSRGACWGSVALVRDRGEPHFNPDEIAFVEGLCDHVALGLRLALLRETETASGDAVPATLILRNDLTVESATAHAAQWLDAFPADRGTGFDLPAAIVAVARRAQAADATSEAPAAARVRLVSGRWLVLHAAALAAVDAEAQRIAVTLAPAGPVEMTPLRLELYGLSPREREVARLLVRGLSNEEIARALHITRYTVKDHVKAIYAKLGVTTRHELSAKLFADHSVPALTRVRVEECAPTAATSIATGS